MKSSSEIFVKPHTKTSREVKDSDLKRVKEDANKLLLLCFMPHGVHKGGYAVAHPQIDDKDPLRFFVTSGSEVIINPKIIRHTQFGILKQEGCLSYPEVPKASVERFYKVTCEFQVILNDKLSEPKTIELKGLPAQIWQHEIDHLNAKYVIPV